ncbi:MAG: FkbM family methyltransferase [Saprospiraceae bacterium]|nr:FkbM family methyltransferase [Saprospiraceae bacterium]
MKGSVAVSKNINTESIQTITLDTLIIQLGLNYVNLIKIDIEGYELFALKGLRSVLNSKNAPDIIFEL